MNSKKSLRRVVSKIMVRLANIKSVLPFFEKGFVYVWSVARDFDPYMCLNTLKSLIFILLQCFRIGHFR